MIADITSLEEFNGVIKTNKGVLFYFSHEECNVCKVLKPKIYNLLLNKFPRIKMYYSNTFFYPEIAAQNSIFTVPAILIFFDGKEFIRKSRNIGTEELRKEIERPYGLIFD